MQLRLAASILLMPLLAGPARADRIEAASRIDAVSVHPDGARVVRRVEVELPKGVSTVAVGGMPRFLDAEGIRVTGTSDEPIAIVGQAFSPTKPPVQPAADVAAAAAASARLTALRDQREALKGRIDALAAKQLSILRFSETPVGSDNEGRLPDIEAVTRRWDAIGDGLAKVNEDLARTRAGLRELDAAFARAGGEQPEAVAQAAVEPPSSGIDALLRPVPHNSGWTASFVPRPPSPPAPAAPPHEFTVSVDAASGGKAFLDISYDVPQARWGAAYDATLRTAVGDAKPTLEIVRRALVSQNSGEDWADARLTIETANLARGGSLVAVEPLTAYLAPLQQDGLAKSVLPSVQGGKVPSGDMSDRLMLADAERIAGSKGLSAMVQMQATVAAAETRGTSHSFRFPTPVTVTGDGSVRTLRLGETRIEPKVRVDVSPRIDPTAYLGAGFSWPDEIPLFPGVATLVTDGVGVGKARIPFLSAGDEHTIGFGADDLVRVSRGPERGASSETGILSVTRTDASDTLTTVTNRHRGPVDVRLTDRIPNSDDAEVKVEVKAVTPTPDETGVKDRPRVVSWNKRLAPGESLAVRVAYSVSWPKARQLQYRGR